MKKYITLLVFFVTTYFYAQTIGINYQAVIYNPNPELLPGHSQTNAPLSNQKVCLKFSIIDATSTVEYQETINTTTDEFGMVNLIIGTGDPVGGYAGIFDDIIWDSTTKRLQVELDPSEKCSNFLEISNQPFTAVPFAFAAKRAENVTGIVAIANGGTGASTVSGAKTNLGLNNVDNTSDLNKPISLATQSALDLKENTANKSDNVNLGTSSILFPTQNAVKTYVDSKINSGGADLVTETTRAIAAETLLTNTKEDKANKSTDGTLATNSDVKFPTEKAVKTYVDANVLALNNTFQAQMTARTDADEAILDYLDNEVNRATAAESALENTKENTANKSTDGTLATNSDIKFPTEQAVKTYVDTQVTAATPDASILVKGKIKLAGDLTGTADIPLIQNNVINSAKIANATIVNEDIANATITSDKIAGTISVANGGTGADMSNSAGYIKQATLGGSFTTVYPIPATDVFGAIRSVNGILPNTNTGNVTVPLGKVETGVLADIPTISNTTNGDIYVVSGDSSISNNGRTFISTGASGSWNEVISNQASTDSRYVQLTGSTMQGNLAFPSSTKITVEAVPTSSSDVTNKNYVDSQIASGAPNATTTLIGKVQLAGDLGGSGTTASAPVISNSAIITNKIADAAVTNVKLANDAVTTDKILDGTIINEDIANASITTSKISGAISIANGGTGATSATEALANLGAEPKANKSIAADLGGNTSSNTLFPSQLAVKTYVDASATAGTTALNNEITRATNAETTLTTNLATEVTRATNAETTLTTNLATEVTRATAAETTLTNDLAAEVTRATTVENTKEDKINKSTDVTLADTTNTKFPTELAVKTYVDASATAGTTALNNEITRATNAETTLTTNLATEVTRATAAETTLTTNLATEVTRATAAETTLTNDLAAEVTRATTVENTKEDKINKSTDVTLADTTNTKFPTELAVKTYVDASATAGTTALNNEITRATQAEALKQDISNKSTDGTFANSNVNDIKYPTTQAVKTYVDTQITASVTPDATTTTKGKIRLAGDLAGTADAPTVPGLALKSPLASPALTGTPTAPTATAGTNTTQLATTAFVTTAVAAATIPDATTSVKGKIQLAGDLAGTAEAPLVVKIQNVAVNTTAPSTGQLLQFDGLSWKPVSASAIIKMETEEVTPSDGQSSFTTSNTPIGKLAFYINGVRVPKNAISISGSTISYNPIENGNYVILGTDRISFDYIY